MPLNEYKHFNCNNSLSIYNSICYWAQVFMMEPTKQDEIKIRINKSNYMLMVLSLAVSSCLTHLVYIDIYCQRQFAIYCLKFLRLLELNGKLNGLF